MYLSLLSVRSLYFFLSTYVNSYVPSRVDCLSAIFQGVGASFAMCSIADLQILPLKEIIDARSNMPGSITNTPLVPFNFLVDGKQIYLKLENLQSVGSFKVRGAYHALLSKVQSGSSKLVYTSSAGNFAQGLAWSALKHEVPCQVIVPSTAPATKLEAIKRLGAGLISVPYDQWWNVMMERNMPGMNGIFIHPTCDRDVMIGNGSIGLEIIEAVPDVDSIICSFGGGGHSLGIASAVKATKPNVRVYACEVDSAAPLSTSLKRGKPSAVENHRSSFVDGMGGKCLFPEVWTMISYLLEGSIVLSESEICEAIRLLMERNHIVAEGAGAATVAAALSGKVPGEKIVCVISGGNIDLKKLSVILTGCIPK